LATFAIQLSAGCQPWYTVDDSYVDSSSDAVIRLDVTANDVPREGTFKSVSVKTPPKCGKVNVDKLDILFDKSAGIGAGTYYFEYELTVRFATDPDGYWEAHDRLDDSIVRVRIKETYPSPDGSLPCNAPYNAFLDRAYGHTNRVEYYWYVPEVSPFADSYKIQVFNGEPGSGNPLIASQTITSPPAHEIQYSAISFSGPDVPQLIWITLQTIKDGAVVHTRTLKGVATYAAVYYAIDNHANMWADKPLVVDMLANDKVAEGVLSSPPTLTIVDKQNLDISTSGGSVIVNPSKIIDNYVIKVRTTSPDIRPQTQNLYLKVLDATQMPPTANDDSFTRFAGEVQLLDVLANDYSFLGGPVQISSAPSWLIQAGDFLWIKRPVGQYTFTYSIRDIYGNEDWADVSVKLIKKPANPPPPPPGPIYPP